MAITLLLLTVTRLRVYRDLQPDNVLVGANGHIMLADFGVAKRLLNDSSAEGENGRGGRVVGAKSCVGTPGYMAPEVLCRRMLDRSGKGKDGERAELYSYAVDWWALGAVIHTMLTLDEPYGMQTVLEVIAKPGRAHEAARRSPHGAPPWTSQLTPHGPPLATVTQVIAKPERAQEVADHRISSDLSEHAGNVVRALLTFDPHERLGSGEGGAKDVQAHAFFEGLNWDKLYRMELPPPLPRLCSHYEHAAMPRIQPTVPSSPMAIPVAMKDKEA